MDKSANLFHKDTLASGLGAPSSDRSHQSNRSNPYQMGEYAQIDLLPTRTLQSNYSPYLLSQSANRNYPTEPIYESLDHC